MGYIGCKHPKTILVKILYEIGYEPYQNIDSDAFAPAVAIRLLRSERYQPSTSSATGVEF